MKTQEDMLQSIIDDAYPLIIKRNQDHMNQVEDVIRWARTDLELAKYINVCMRSIIREAERHGD